MMARRHSSAARAPHNGAVVAEEEGLVEGDGLPEGDLVALEGDLERRHARHSGLVRYLGRVLENEATVGRDTGADSAGSGLEAAVFVQWSEWPRRRAGR